jgi:hypothetical protein
MKPYELEQPIMDCWSVCNDLDERSDGYAAIVSMEI